MIRHSIRWQLQIWHGLLLTVIIAGFGMTAHQLSTSNRLRQVDQELQAHLAQISIAVPPPAMGNEAVSMGGRRLPPRSGTSILDQVANEGAFLVVWDSQGSEQAAAGNRPEGLDKPVRRLAGESISMMTVGENRLVISFTGAGRCFLVGRSIHKEQRELHLLANYLTAAGTAVLAFGLLVGWVITTRAIRPIAVISETAEKIASGDLSMRIPTGTSMNELGRLAQVLNSTFARLESAFAQQARFTADAAHELRTPITAMLMHAENGLASQDLTEEQREAFAACQRAAQRMKKLISSLLELSRLDAGQEPVNRQLMDLAEVAQDCVELIQALADERGIRVELELLPVTCSGDAQRIGQVILNLLSNAIEHTRDRIIIHSEADQTHAILRVTDNGPGIPTHVLPRVFERFYRADEARQHGAQHSGLGLAISKAIMEAHGGSLEVTSEAGQGTCFILRLPLLNAAVRNMQPG
jgi:two-component system OmpR family sensor kinase